MDLRINETRQTGALRKPPLPFFRWVGTVSNCADAVRLETEPTGGESVYLFLQFTITNEMRLGNSFSPALGYLELLEFCPKHWAVKNFSIDNGFGDLTPKNLCRLPEFAAPCKFVVFIGMTQ